MSKFALNAVLSLVVNGIVATENRHFTNRLVFLV